MRVVRTYLCVSLIIASLALGGCASSDSDASQTISAAFLNSGKLSIYDFSDGSRGSLLDEVDLDGESVSGDGLAFDINAKTFGSPVQIVLTEAQLSDQATGESLQFESSDSWQLTLPSLPNDTEFRITPFTTLASCKLAFELTQLTESNEQAVAAAISAANNLIEEHLQLDAITSGPIPLLSSTVTNITGSVLHALLLAGFSRLAVDYSLDAELTPLTTINIITLTEGLCADIEADGLLDGEGGLSSVTVGGINLTDRTMRIDLAMSTVRFLDEVTKNGTTVVGSDIATTLNQTALNSNADLFSLTDAVFSLDFDAPSVSIAVPAEDTTWSTAMQSISVSSIDNGSGVASLEVALTFADGELALELNQFDQNESIEVVEGSIDITGLADGVYIVVATATDLLGNQASVSKSVLIDLP